MSVFFSVGMSVICEEPEQVASVMESLGRVAAGIALEGRTVSLTVITIEDEEE